MLSLNDSKLDEIYQSNYDTLLGIVDEKIKHKEHVLRGSPLRRAQMLALVMYTGMHCTSNLFLTYLLWISM